MIWRNYLVPLVTSLPTEFWVFLILLVSCLPGSAYGQSGSVPDYDLEVHIDISRAEIRGISRIKVKGGEELHVNRGALKVSSVKLNNEPLPARKSRGRLLLLPEEDGEVEIRYTGRFRPVSVQPGREMEGIPDSIDARGVSLTGIWYPRIEGLFHYRLRATLPKGYQALSEAEDVVVTEKNGSAEFTFHFPHPLDDINLVASDRYEVVRDRFGEIELYAYFLREDIDLADTYVEFTKKYLSLYEEIIGEFPYKRFSVVENFLPTGYSMPTFTLLGSSVVRLPFIVETSLGHEILHQWFGNHVFVDHTSGNWAEGLTTYLADHLYDEQKGKGWEHRKQILINYQSYVTEKNEFPLKDFLGGGNRASRAIGYGKTALVFHMIKSITGEGDFYDSLRSFISDHKYRRASWDDLRLSFERQTGRDLTSFFSQWIDDRGVPVIGLKDVEVRFLKGNYAVSFTVTQEKRIFDMDVPVTIYAQGRKIKNFFRIDSEEKEVKVFLSEKPETVVLDEDYDVVRGLDVDEFPPVLARLLGGEEFLLALPAEKRKIYQSIIDEFRRRGAEIRKAGDIGHSDVASSTLIVLGSDNPLLKRLYGAIPRKDEGFAVEIKENPWNARKVVALFHGKSKEEVDAAFQKISHYGKYTTLHFKNGRNIEKGKEGEQRGIVVRLAEETPAVDIQSLRGLPGVIEGVADKRIVYVGEVHDVFAHHAVQLDIITGVYGRHRKLAIGMEMFQRPFQETLDDFVQGKIDEREFLKKSEYFRRWGFDYNLYKPILDFARSRRVPVVALNLDREIVREVSEGGLDSLGKREKESIPPDMDFSDSEYRKRLELTFRLHRGSEDRNFDHFYQSQILWDETMSRSIDEYLRANPGYRMVVLAGQGHLAYGSGIPKRTFRRNGLEYAITLIDAGVAEGIADYVLFPQPVEGFPSPKLMVFLEEEEERLKIAGFPEDSVSERAGLETGDILLSIDDVFIENLDDIKIHLLSRTRGDVVRIRVLRKEERRQRSMEFDVEL